MNHPAHGPASYAHGFLVIFKYIGMLTIRMDTFLIGSRAFIAVYMGVIACPSCCPMCGRRLTKENRMGMSISFYAGHFDSFKHYRELEDKAESMLQDFSDRHHDVLAEFSDTQLDACLKNPKAEMPYLPEYAWMTKEEFAEWFKAFQDSYLALKTKAWYELPQLRLGKAYWFVQWLLDRHRAELISASSGEELCPHYESEVTMFLLTSEDLDDLDKRLSAPMTKRADLLRQFPIYGDLAYGSNRRTDYGRETEEILLFKNIRNIFRDKISYVRKNILENGYWDLFVEVFP